MNAAHGKGFRAGMNLVNPAACPYKYYEREARDWHQGHQDGHQLRYRIQMHENRLYRNEKDRFDMLWG